MPLTVSEATGKWDPTDFWSDEEFEREYARQVATLPKVTRKENPYHDELGRFASGPGGGFGDAPVQRLTALSGAWSDWKRAGIANMSSEQLALMNDPRLAVVAPQGALASGDPIAASWQGDHLNIGGAAWDRSAPDAREFLLAHEVSHAAAADILANYPDVQGLISPFRNTSEGSTYSERALVFPNESDSMARTPEEMLADAGATLLTHGSDVLQTRYESEQKYDIGATPADPRLARLYDVVAASLERVGNPAAPRVQKSRGLRALWERIRKDFDPDQPRDDQGRWATSSGSGADASHPFVTTSVDEAARALAAGKYVDLRQERGLSTLMDRLAADALDAKAKGVAAPVYDLGKVTIQGTNLFMNGNLGVPRVDMPQLSGIPEPGSPADSMPKDDQGRVNLSGAFTVHLASLGVGVSSETVLASELRATQNGLDGSKVAVMMDQYESGELDPSGRAIWTTSDGYVLDGHHQWAAIAGVQYETESDKLKVLTSVIDMPITEALREAQTWTRAMGIAGRAVGKMLKDYDPDQARDDKGMWTKAPGGRLTLTPEPGMSRRGEAGLRYPALWMHGDRAPSKPGYAMTGRIVGMKYDAELDVAPGTDRAPMMDVNGREIQASEGYVTAFDERVLPGIQLYADEKGIPLQTVLDTMQANAQQFYDDSRACVAVDSHNLASALDDGLKNQFLTKDSNGSYAPGLRKDAESELFGLPLTGVPGAERPIYGYVGDLDGSNGSGVSQYGDVVLVLNADIAERATVSSLDSLDRTSVPEPMTDVTWRQSALAPGAGSSGAYAEGWRMGTAGHDVEGIDHPVGATETAGAYQFQLGAIILETVPPFMDGRKLNPEAISSGYVEAQIFGGVRTSDIAEVVFRISEQVDPVITARLDAAGIPWSVSQSTSRKWSPP
jgi:hypothetical protein